ncbi:hypothetical protein IKG20_00360 [Candidatus Saccharibacteria bacterium]|nr:hypothetical protein [Candidatus Saccharibacteria bacterium]
MKFGHHATKKGFTLVELSFAIAFISILLITITLITNEIVSIYRKGYSIKAVNQVGRDLIDDFQNSITQSPPASTSSFCETFYSDSDVQEQCKNNKGFFSVYQQYYTKVRVHGGSDTAKPVPTGGIFCSGKYTYIWNTGYLFNTEETYEFVEGSGDKTSDKQNALKLRLKYDAYESNSETHQKFASGNFRLAKIEDTSRAICTATLKTESYPSTLTALAGPDNGNREITIPFQLPNDPEELINSSDAALALFDLVVFQPARVTSTNRLLFSGSFILGTITGGVDIMATGDYCKAPTYFSADYSYCAINKFNFTIQASGG